MFKREKIIMADNDPEFLSSCRKALSLRGINIIEVPFSGPMIWEAILQLRPQAVLCGLFLPGCDAVHLVEKAKRELGEDAPAFAAFCSISSDRLFERFFAAGGAYAFIKPADPRWVAQQTALLLEKRRSASGEPAAPFDPDQQISRLLHQAGVPHHLAGYRCLKLALSLLCREPERYFGAKGLYETVAQQMNSSYPCVERNIRTAVEAAVLRADPQIFRELFGSSISPRTGRPGNIQFICALHEQLCQTDGTLSFRTADRVDYGARFYG